MRIEFEDNFDEFDVIENVYVPATEEVSEYSEHEPDYLSDYYVNLLGQHMVEWDTYNGRYWAKYDEQECKEVLDRNKMEWEEFKKRNGKPFEWLEKYMAA